MGHFGRTLIAIVSWIQLEIKYVYSQGTARSSEFWYVVAFHWLWICHSCPYLISDKSGGPFWVIVPFFHNDVTD